MVNEESEMTEYERRRRENINRNFQKLSSLKLHSHLSDLRSTKKWKKKSVQAVSRSSLRTQGIPPDFDGLPKDYNESLRLRPSKADTKPQETVYYAGSVYMRDVYLGQDSHRTLVDNFDHASSVNVKRVKAKGCSIDFNSFKLEPWNVARVVSENILAVRFLPTVAMTIVVVGNRHGELGFWDVGKGKQGDQAIHRYRPHTVAISGISVHPFALSKVYTSSHDGVLKLMNSEREEFKLVYSSVTRSGLYSMSQPLDEPNSLYVGEGLGLLKVFDGRARKIVNSWGLHEERINTIDVSPANSNIIATASTDGLACLWDLRKMDVENGNCRALCTLDCGKAVRSAYFSPSGNNLASSVDGCVSVIGGANFEDFFEFQDLHHCRITYTNAPLRAVWGWDDNHIFAGDSRRSINILSVRQRKIAYSLKSSLMSAISSRYDAHPYNIGMMAAATLGGSVFVWTAATTKL